MPHPTVLRLRDITKRFGPLIANDAICLDLAEGEVLALLGENGAGKTTLMNILFGHYVADAGTVEVFGQELPPGKPRAAIEAGVGMVHQHFTLADNLTVLENVVLGTERLFTPRQDLKGAARRLRELGREFGLEVDPRARVRDLSVGERQRVEILKVLYRNARILILDEPTAVLTPPEVDSLFLTLRRLVGRGLAVVFISHKLAEVMAISDRVAVLRGGRVVHETGIDETSREALAEAMVGREIPKPKRVPLNPGKPLLGLDGVTVRGEHGKVHLQEASLDLREHEILGIAGVSGNGQAQLADLLCGLLGPDEGRMTLADGALLKPSPRAMVRHGIGRIVEDRNGTGLIGDMTITENLASESYREKRFSRFGLLRFAALREHAGRLVREFDVRCPGISAPVRKLSGGNMQKLVLARVLARNPSVILAHQPTWGLDVGAASYVHSQLLAARERGAATLLISEDLDELLQLSDRIQVIYHGRLSPPLDAGEVTLQQLGLLMSGQDFAAAG
ncbi:sugar ABC transporter ATP-binding protein [Desulfuromonas versatilis]|uniref:Sugar ABC transporter ATP-binding protein n=1 Tax=Desulfuromonas versatilis TaxID=2802975 RepID=A0ABN6DTH6_9BACT|nr:ABC transporter ATP-binding protein [Desulfuromonas versatilis]BCR03443.1 sugar ABC transporter ATP-binding protein [Desulfuromonas versatilis]